MDAGRLSKTKVVLFHNVTKFPPPAKKIFRAFAKLYPNKAILLDFRPVMCYKF